MSEISGGNKFFLNYLNIIKFPLSAFTIPTDLYAHIYHPTIPPSSSLVLTLQFRAAVAAAVLLTIGGAINYLWDTDQELAVIPEDHHSQFAPAFFHQVLGLQQGEILCRHAIDLVTEQPQLSKNHRFYFYISLI